MALIQIKTAAKAIAKRRGTMKQLPVWLSANDYAIPQCSLQFLSRVLILSYPYLQYILLLIHIVALLKVHEVFTPFFDKRNIFGLLYWSSSASQSKLDLRTRLQEDQIESAS